MNDININGRGITDIVFAIMYLDALFGADWTRETVQATDLARKGLLPLSRDNESRLLTLTEAAQKYGYQRHWLQKLLISGRLEGHKNVFGHWRVTVRGMDALSVVRQEREGKKKEEEEVKVSVLPI